jgi:hypothetical protein
MLDSLGLAWDERVLKFRGTERPVRTASVNQVREPIYRAFHRPLEEACDAYQATTCSARRSGAMGSALVRASSPVVAASALPAGFAQRTAPHRLAPDTRRISTTTIAPIAVRAIRPMMPPPK